VNHAETVALHGVMAVMAVADTAKFDLMKQLKRRSLLNR